MRSIRLLSLCAFMMVPLMGLQCPEGAVNVLPPPTPILYIANLESNSVTSYQNPATVNGDIAPDTILQGDQTQLIAPVDVVVDASGALTVVNGNTLSITSYDNAPNANGNLAPDRIVLGDATLLSFFPLSVAVAPATDLVFVNNNGMAQILVFGNASSPAFNGDVAPIRTIVTTTTGDLADPIGINFGSNDDLYVANQEGGNVLVFANASNLSGDVTPTRTIESASITSARDAFVDQNDNLFVVGNDRFVFTFRNASTLDGTVDPDFTLEVPGGIAMTAIAVDSSDTGYIIDRNNAVYSYDNISTRDGAVNPDRTIAGPNTQLDGPHGIFLAE